MSVVILLDAGPLGLITNPRVSQETRDCNLWLESLVLKEVQVKIPEIADYEVRRELLRVDKFKGIKRLDDLQRICRLNKSSSARLRPEVVGILHRQ